MTEYPYINSLIVGFIVCYCVGAAFSATALILHRSRRKPPSSVVGTVSYGFFTFLYAVVAAASWPGVMLHEQVTRGNV